MWDVATIISTNEEEINKYPSLLKIKRWKGLGRNMKGISLELRAGITLHFVMIRYSVRSPLLLPWNTVAFIWII